MLKKKGGCEMEIVSNGNRNATNNARGYHEETHTCRQRDGRAPRNTTKVPYKNGFMEKNSTIEHGQDVGPKMTILREICHPSLYRLG